MSEPGDVTQMLLDWSGGDSEALGRLMPLIFEQLRRQAGAYLRRERQGHTLQPTALVNEVYLKMVDQERIQWQDRAHFYAVAARFMRRILVDHARAVRAEKRGSGVEHVTFDEERDMLEGQSTVDVLALDSALDGLAKLDERQAKVVELRFFGGLSVEETASVLDVARATVNRDWRNARAWLLRELKHAE